MIQGCLFRCVLVPWKADKGARDEVVHDYPEVDLGVLWDTLAYGRPIVHRASSINPKGESIAWEAGDRVWLGDG